MSTGSRAPCSHLSTVSQALQLQDGQSQRQNSAMDPAPGSMQLRRRGGGSGQSVSLRLKNIFM